MSHYQFLTQIERDSETGVYMATVPALPRAHTQAANMDQLQINLKAVIAVCLEELSAEEMAGLHELIGVEQVAVEV